MRLSLAQRFNLYVGGIVLLGLAVLLVYDYDSERRLVRGMGLAEAERLSDIVFDQLHTSMKLGGGRGENRAIIERLNAVKGIEKIRVIHGRALNSQFGVEADEQPLDEADMSALAGNKVSRIERLPDGNNAIRLTAPVFARKDCLGCHRATVGEVIGAISIKISLTELEAAKAAHSKNFILWGGGLFLITTISVFVMVGRRLLEPLERLKESARAIASGNLHHRAGIDTGDEIEDLGKALDDMASSLLRTSSQLADARETYAAFVRMAVDAIVLINIETKRFVDANPAATEITGYSREELLMLTPDAIYPHEKLDEYGEAFDRWVYDGKGYLRDAVISRRDSSRVPVEIAASALELNGERYMLEIWRDISERKGFGETIKRYVAELENTVRERTSELNVSLLELESAYKKLKDSEQKLIQSAKMSSLGEMGAGIAHELNSPIAGILTITELLLNRSSPDDRNYLLLEKMKDAAVRSKYIILDMMTYARQAKEGFKPFFLNEAINATLFLFISEIKNSSIEIIKNFQTDLPRVCGSQGRIMEVMLNMIKNARDAIGGNGKIFISTSTVTEAAGTFAVAEIRDTGHGIPDEVMDKIFDPFFTTKEKGGGMNMGLGLSISNSIVKEHGGRIDVQSALGEGACFRVYLPVDKEKDRES
ncbi:MAG: PAS domain S-box protein [Deltaproteobacteria bacterium]|nr:PAS domain S-box protein [Deltaproteobacteria bacterium]